MKLLDAANVQRGDGRWTAGLEVENLQCALSSALSALCLPGPADNIGGGGTGSPSGQGITVFGVITRLRQPNMCRTADPEAVVRDAVDAEIEKALGRAIWFGGNNEAEVWFGATGATALTSGTPTVADALRTWYGKTVGIEPIIHLGIKAAESVATQLADNGRFKAWPDVPVVVNPSYPASGIAVSGPIDVWVTPTETIQSHSFSVNREQTEASALVGVVFDPCAVVIVGALPDQVYIAKTTVAREITVYVTGSTTSATVSWGDATADGSVSPNSNTSHTYAASGTYTVTVTSEGGASTFTVTV